MRPLLASFVVFLLMAAAAQAQSYTLKLKGQPGPGKSALVTEKAKIAIAFSVSLDGNVLKEEKKIVNEEKQFTEKVEIADDKGPTKFTRAYGKAAKGEDGELTNLSYAGKTIVFERKNGKFDATALEGGVDPKDLSEILKQINAKKYDDSLVPKKAIQVGDAWPIGKEGLGGFLGDLKDGADYDNFKGRGKLTNAYKKNGQQWGTLEITLAVPVKTFGPINLDKGIPFELKLVLDSPIDGSSAAHQVQGTLGIKGVSQFEQNGMTIVVDVSVHGELHRDQSPEK